MFYIFEMANNHMGSVFHGKLIIDRFSEIARRYDIDAGMKFQFRQLDTFIHRDFIDSDLKYVKRFKETELSKDQFRELIDYSKEKGLKTVATPFDNESISWLEDLDVEIVKIASCSVDDWLLLKDVCEINKKIIISTGGAEMDTLHKVYNIFKSRDRDFAFMHCVGEYPTKYKHANLNRINILRQEFPDIQIGFSTHEVNGWGKLSLVPYAIAMGCSIVEKHVGVVYNDIKLNDYSCSPRDMETILHKVKAYNNCCNTPSDTEKDTLNKLKRGIYAKRDLKFGEVISKNDIYLAMPVADGQMDGSMLHDCIGKYLLNDVNKDFEIRIEDCDFDSNNDIISKIKMKALDILDQANISVSRDDDIEISCHYGIDNFFKAGVLIMSRINREYCKKILIVFDGQNHPTHKHFKKEESFELLYGDCKLIVSGICHQMVKGESILIPRNAEHSFSSEDGCVIEEVSTTHYVGDSIYNDFNINKLDISERKININF